MIKLETDIVGKKAYYGEVKHMLKDLGYCIGGNWDYEMGSFDSTLSREGGETIYIRIPFHVIQGILDRDDALIEFQTPYIIKHVVNVGLDTDASSLLTASFNQFQEPVDPDGNIEQKSKWENVGEQEVNTIVQNIVDMHS